MKRIALASVLMVIAAVLISAYRDDPLYWKRRALSKSFRPTMARCWMSLRRC